MAWKEASRLIHLKVTVARSICVLKKTDLIGSVDGSDSQGVMLLRYLLRKINRRNKGRKGERGKKGGREKKFQTSIC